MRHLPSVSNGPEGVRERTLGKRILGRPDEGRTAEPEEACKVPLRAGTKVTRQIELSFERGDEDNEKSGVTETEKYLLKSSQP